MSVRILSLAFSVNFEVLGQRKIDVPCPRGPNGAAADRAVPRSGPRRRHGGRLSERSRVQVQPRGVVVVKHGVAANVVRTVHVERGTLSDVERLSRLADLDTRHPPASSLQKPAERRDSCLPAAVIRISSPRLRSG